MATVLRSANLGPSVFFVFYYNFVDHLLQNFVHICHRQREQMLQIWSLYDFYFLICAYIVAKLYIPTYGLATIYGHTRKSKSHNNQICSICSRCL